MQNPWKLTTLVLGAAMLISSARAETSWKQDALTHLQSAAKILSDNGGSETGKHPGGEPPKKQGGTTAKDKALQLTRAAIVQLKNAGADAD